MKKLLLAMIAFVGLMLGANAQTKNRNGSMRNKPQPTSVVVRDSVAVIKEQAEKWFRDVYVEKHFNDPYSYRLMKVSASPVTLKEALEIDLGNVKMAIDTCSIPKKERTPEGQKKLEGIIKDRQTNIEELNKQLDAGTGNREYLIKMRDIYLEYLNKYIDYKKRLDICILAIQTYDKIKNSIDELSEQSANQIAYYLIKLDCYSKNKMGNEMLGRFEFPFNKEGIFRGEKSVVQTNK